MAINDWLVSSSAINLLIVIRCCIVINYLSLVILMVIDYFMLKSNCKGAYNYLLQVIKFKFQFTSNTANYLLFNCTI